MSTYSKKTRESKTIPRVTVLMAVFNTAPFLLEALVSIRDQTFSEFEMIAIDDGSTDGSRQILESFAASEPRMTLISRENLGLVATRNQLLACASGELVAWMDSDDISLPDRLMLQVQFFDSDQEVVCVGGAVQCIDPDGQFLNVDRYPCAHADILCGQERGGAMRFPATMMKRDVAVDVGGFRYPFSIGEDFDLLLRMSEVGKMANLDATIYLYRQHLSSICAALGPVWVAYRDVILDLARERREHGTDRLQQGDSVAVPTPPTSRNTWIECVIYVNWSHHAMANGNRRLARKYAKAALQVRPLAPIAWKAIARTALKARR